MPYLQGLLKTPEGWATIAGIIFMLLMTNACHEGGHALSAWWAGDRRPSIRRRCTLNPINHFHWLLTLVLPVLSIWLFGFMVGGARPVLINAGQIGPRRMALVALAGPAGNFLFAGFMVAVFGFAMAQEWIDPVNPISSWAWKITKPAIWFSILLGLLNLVPIPPLDGSRVVAMFMPERVRAVWYALAPLGILVVLFGWLWFSGFLARHGMGEGYPQFLVGLSRRTEDYLFVMSDFWKMLLS